MSAFSAAGLETLERRLASHCGDHTVPGLVGLVARNGESHVICRGVREWSGAAVNRDTIFRIASMSKPITAAATLALADEGLLDLHAPIEQWIPELANRRVLRSIDAPVTDTVAAKRSITAHDCLTFTFGYGYLGTAEGDPLPVQLAEAALQLGQGPPQPNASVDAEEWIRQFATLPLMYQPGERWLYNTGALVLSVLVQRASGQPFDAFVKERVLEPLGMHDTSFWVPEDKLDRFTTAYSPDFAGQRQGPVVYDDARAGQWTSRPRFPKGDSGLVSTVEDFARFASMLANGGELGGARVLSTSAVEAMTTDHLTTEQKAVSGLVDGYFDTHGFGYGVTVVTAAGLPEGRPAAYGWDGGLGSVWRNDPTTGMTAVLLTNMAWDRPIPPQVFVDFFTAAYEAVGDG